MKKFILILISCLLCAATIKTRAQSGTDGGIAWSIKDGTLTISANGNGEMPDYSYDPTNGSTAPWAVYRGALTALVIEPGVARIGDYAFCEHSNLTGNLTLPEGITSIGDRAFYQCYRFTGSLTLPEGLTSIGDGAFSNCFRFTGSLTLPEGLMSIGNAAFSGCYGFNGSLTLPEGLTSIGNGAFLDCYGFTGSLTLPEGLTSIGNAAFSGCYGFTGSLTLPEGLTSIGDGAFSNCFRFTGSLTLPESLTSIGGRAFYVCRGFTGSLTFPGGLTSIGKEAFYGCYGFTGSLTLPEGLTNIGEGAFFSCNGFNGSLTLPEGLSSIGYGAFAYCDDFAEVINYATEPQVINAYVFSDVPIENIPLHVPAASVAAYSIAAVWMNFKSIEAIGFNIITVLAEGNGTAIANKKSAAQGETITLTATAYAGYQFKEWTSESAGVTFFNANSASTGFLMPANNVIITAQFEPATVVTYAATISNAGAETSDSPLARVYPNPTEGMVTLEFETPGVYNLTLADLTGKILLRRTVSDRTTLIDLGAYPAGAYLLTINDGKRQSVTRIVKN